MKSRETSAPFELGKWYLDCVSDRGEVIIAYVAEVRWRALALRYTSVLVQRAGEETKVRATLSGAPPPGIDGREIRWSAPALGVSARFTRTTEEVADTVLSRGDGRVEWRCHAPRARARFDLEGGAIEGLGYVEHLTLTLAPWRLPIDALRWGRFLAEDTSLVWIDWRGPHEHQRVFLDGAALGPCRVDDHGLRSADGATTLTLAPPRCLRRGALGKTALSILPAVDTVFPARILATEEHKWVTRGALVHQGSRHEGWVIHEVVRWP